MEDQKNNEVLYNVMPKEGNLRGKNIETNAIPTPSESVEKPVTSSFRKWPNIIISLIALLALGAATYYMLGFKDSTNEPQEEGIRLPDAWLNTHFNSDTCSNESVCGLNADPENDGLGNYDEFKAGTNPLNPDTDSDGLADGDEINIFKTEPMLKYTDRREDVARNDWTDGFQLKNGYDPLTPALKLTDPRNQQISEDSAKFGLHEPTITTFSGQPTDQTADWKLYLKTEFNIEILQPTGWIFNKINSNHIDLAQPSDGLLGDGITIGKTPGNLTDFLNDLNQDLKLISSKTEVKNGITWQKYIHQEKETSMRFLTYATEFNNKVISLGIIESEESERNKVLIQILSTFKFTN